MKKTEKKHRKTVIDEIMKILIILMTITQTTLTEKIQELSSDTFMSFINNNDLALVKFYAKWCSHCKDFESQYQRLARQMKALQPGLALAKINGEEDTDLSEYYDIDKYPALVFFLHGEPIHYEGLMQYDGVKKWLIDVFRYEPAQIETQEAMVSLSANLDHVHVFTGDQDSPAYLHIRLLAKKLGYIPVFYTIDPNIANRYSLKKEGLYTVSFSRQEILPYNGVIESEMMKKFVVISRFGHLIKFDKVKFSELFRNRIPILCIFGGKDDHSLERMVDRLRVGYQSHMIAVKFDDASDEGQGMFWRFCGVGSGEGVEGGIDKGLCVVEPGKELKKFKYKDQELSEDKIDRFILGYLSGELTEDLKVEKIKEQYTGDILVKNNFLRKKFFLRSTILLSIFAKIKTKFVLILSQPGSSAISLPNP